MRRLGLRIEPHDLLDAAAAAATAYVPFSGKQSEIQSSRNSTATESVWRWFSDGFLVKITEHLAFRGLPIQ